MTTRVSRRTHTAVLQVAPVAPASGGTPRRPTGSSRSFAELLAEAEKVGGMIASRQARPVSNDVPSTHAQSMHRPFMHRPVSQERGIAWQGSIAQGMALRLRDREEEKSRPGEEPEG